MQQNGRRKHVYRVFEQTMTDQQLQKFYDAVNSSRHIVFFGGAGVSTESGIPDFRSADGLYNQTYKYPPEEILSVDFFYRHTELFFKFYREKMIFADSKPNVTHFALAALERAGKLSAVVTQNIDGLHQAAGSKNVLELHGTVHSNHCVKCLKRYGLDAIMQSEGVPRCKCGGVIKPDVVLYGEQLPQSAVHGAIEAIYQSDCLIVGGTSLTVYPAAGFVNYFRGNDLILINKQATPLDKQASITLHCGLGQAFRHILEEYDDKN